MMIEELNCLCQMVDELPESVQKNIETLLMEYGNVRNLYGNEPESCSLKRRAAARMVRGEARLCVTADRELYINRAGGEERRLRLELAPPILFM